MLGGVGERGFCKGKEYHYTNGPDGVSKRGSIGKRLTSKTCSSAKIKRHAKNSIDRPAIRKANRGDSRELIRANRFAEKNKKNYFHNVRAIRLKPAIRIFCPPKRQTQKKEVQLTSATLKMTRENQAIRANLRIDSCESGHLRPKGGQPDRPKLRHANQKSFRNPSPYWSQRKFGSTPCQPIYRLN